MPIPHGCDEPHTADAFVVLEQPGNLAISGDFPKTSRPITVVTSKETPSRLQPPALRSSSQLSASRNPCSNSPAGSSCPSCLNVAETCWPIICSALLMVEIAPRTPLAPDALSAALSIFCAPSFRSSASPSNSSFAFCPDSVSGLPSPFMSSTNVSVESLTSSAALCNESLVRFPPCSDWVDGLSESVQVVIALQRPSAHSVGLVVSPPLPPSPPQP